MLDAVAAINDHKVKSTDPSDSSQNSTENFRSTFRLGELFAGAGGMALGAHRANLNGCKFTHVWVNDFDIDACHTFAKNFSIKEKNVHCCDVSNLSLKSLPSIDGLVFGFPCNDFSIVGDRNGIEGEFGGLYRHGVRALRTHKPIFFVAENVSGLSSSGNALQTIENELIEAGYNIFKQLYKFENFGVPQCRHRIIIVGFRKDTKVNEFTHPEPITLSNPVTCEEALEGVQLCSHNNEPTRHSKSVLERLRYIKPGQNIFNAKLPEHLQFNMTSNATISQLYRRLVPDRPAYTVTGSGGGGTQLYHWSEDRALTNRERARLQTFPDDFVFLGGKESVRKQIGMAVPPKGAKFIFEAIIKTLANRKIYSQC